MEDPAKYEFFEEMLRQANDSPSQSKVNLESELGVRFGMVTVPVGELDEKDLRELQRDIRVMTIYYGLLKNRERHV